jgi:glutathione S-transferase
MSQYTLYHGNRNYSSWSLRAWLALRQSGADFDTVVFNLGERGVEEQILRASPSGLVPALRHGDLVVHDSLAVGEYLAEQFPEAGLWPADRPPRALARSVSAEMHSGFTALRRSMPMNIRRRSPGKGREEGVADDIARVREIWRGCLAAHGGPYLFGAWSLADAMYAPVVTRFRTYAVELDGAEREYAARVFEQPDMREWVAEAEREVWVEPEYDL